QTAAYRQQPQQTGANGHLLRGARMSLGGGRGNDQQRGDQQHADDLHGQGDHQGDQQHQRQTQTSHRQTLDPRQLLVHGDGQQRSPQGHQQQQDRSEEHTSELQSRENLVCRLLLEKKKIKRKEEEHTCKNKYLGSKVKQ